MELVLGRLVLESRPWRSFAPGKSCWGMKVVNDSVQPAACRHGETEAYGGALITSTILIKRGNTGLRVTAMSGRCGNTSGIIIGVSASTGPSPPPPALPLLRPRPRPPRRPRRHPRFPRRRRRRCGYSPPKSLQWPAAAGLCPHSAQGGEASQALWPSGNQALAAVGTRPPAAASSGRRSAQHLAAPHSRTACAPPWPGHPGGA